MIKFKTTLKRIRKSKSMTQADLAKKSKLTPDWISHFENGRRLPSLKVFASLAKSLDVTLDELLGWK